MGAGGAPPAGEAPAAEAAAERPVLLAKTPAPEEARESKSSERERQQVCFWCLSTTAGLTTLGTRVYFVGDGADAALQPAAD